MGKAASKPSKAPSSSAPKKDDEDTNGATANHASALEEHDESSLIKALRTMKLPNAPASPEVNPQKAALRRSRVIRGRALPEDIHQPRRVCVYLCYSEECAALEVKTIREHAHVFLREWSLNQFDLPADLIDLHEGLGQQPITTEEMEALHLKFIRSMASDEILPIFVRLSSAPDAMGSVVIPSSLTKKDQSRIDDTELMNKYYKRNNNCPSSEPHTLWLTSPLSNEERQEVLECLQASLISSQLKCLEEQEVSLANSLLKPECIVHLQMTNVRATMEQSSFPALADSDTAMHAAAPVLQTATWERPVDMPFGLEATTYDSEQYCLAVCKSYVACLAQAIVGRLGTLAEPDSALVLEMQDHLAFSTSMAPSAQQLPRLYPEPVVKQYILLEKPAPPLVIHAPLGGGRTTAAVQMAALAADLPTKSHTERVIMPRFAGLTPRASNLQSFLHDLNRHLCMVYDGDMKQQPSEEADLVRRWSSVMRLASPYLPVVIIMDADPASLETTAGRPLSLLQWLPPVLPGSVRMIVLTNDAEVKPLRTKIPEAMFRPLALPTKDAFKSALQSHLSLRRRTVSKQQLAGLLSCLPASHVTPLLLAMLGMIACTWTHEHDPPVSVPGAELAVSAFIDVLEKRHSVEVVRMCVLALCICQEGCTDVELATMLRSIGVASAMREWLLLREALSPLVQYHSIHHFNAFTSPHFAALVRARYSAAHVRTVVDTLIATFGKLVGEGGTTTHLSLELSHLLQEHASREQVAAALGEPRFLLHLVASSETAGSAYIKRMWGALSDRQKKDACTAAYRVLMATIPQLKGKKLKRVLDQSAAIASFVDRMDDKELALDLFNQSLKVQERVLGATHPYTLSMAAKVAGVLYKNKQTKKALDVCKAYTRSYVDPASVRHDASFEPCRMEVSALFLLRSNIHLDRNEFSEAKQDLERVLVVYNMHNLTEDSEDVRLAAVWGNLANTCAAMDKHAEALDYYTRALGVFRTTGKRDPKKVCTTLLNISLSQRYLSKFDDALKAAQEAQDIADAAWGAHDKITLEAVHSRAVTMEVMGRHQEALELYREAADGFLALSGRPSPSIVSAIKRCQARINPS
ncbi:hypothetical protein PTSG_08732 [Salpingoeca rosetta]|uniref:Uncharacterized protein n=1 Tax=Salpingoeca rosetta (strain ATCC 50818 / BSB-021) TaxID=946362 RepID=F2UKJ2_SALR5|nr:uncharacterized protein PTSG_08732 [Salpingoeca rosetta]EGD77641.1 hypothetical protein PTSG_08732 [Salpingoeca rosetta]|eukprot:XP_004990117.1 hypothetical protein PTSG_08732 [Salpingoeca rosetta]